MLRPAPRPGPARVARQQVNSAGRSRLSSARWAHRLRCFPCGPGGHRSGPRRVRARAGGDLEAEEERSEAGSPRGW